MEKILLIINASKYLTQIEDQELSFGTFSNNLKNVKLFSEDDKRKIKTLVSCSLRKFFILKAQIKKLGLASLSNDIRQIIHVFLGDHYYLKIVNLPVEVLLKYIKEFSKKDYDLIEAISEFTKLEAIINIGQLIDEENSYLSLKHNVSNQVTNQIIKQYGANNSQKILKAINTNYAAFGRVNTKIVGENDFYVENTDFNQVSDYFLYNAKTHLKAQVAYKQMKFYTVTLPEIVITNMIDSNVKTALIVEDDKTSMYLDVAMKTSAKVDVVVAKKPRYYSINSILKSFELSNVTVFSEDVFNPTIQYDFVYSSVSSSNIGLAFLKPDFFIHFDLETDVKPETIIQKIENLSHNVAPNGVLAIKVNSILREETHIVATTFVKDNSEFVLEYERHFFPYSNDKTLGYIAIFRKKK